MTETRINISEFKNEGSNTIKDLAEFLKERTKAEVETTIDAITIKGEATSVSKKYLRVLLKKFLHKNELKDYFRVIGAEANTLMVKRKKITEEE